MEQEEYFLFIVFSLKANRIRDGYEQEIIAAQSQLVYEPGIKYHRIPVDFDTIDCNGKQISVVIIDGMTYEKEHGAVFVSNRAIAIFKTEEEAKELKEKIQKGDSTNYLKSSDVASSVRVINLVVF